MKRTIQAVVGAALVAVPIAVAAPANAATFTGNYQPVVGKPQWIGGSSFTTTGNTGDPSQPTATISNADGCRIDIYGNDPSSYQQLNPDNAHVFASGVVTAGASPTCEDSPTLSMEEMKVGSGAHTWQLNITDIVHWHAWALYGAQG